MIGYLRGKVTYIFADYCFVETNGIGWRVFAPDGLLRQLHVGEEKMFFTYMNVREDAMQLYGFSERGDYDVFLLLLSVSGIGPKVAMGILSAVSAERLCQAINGKQIKVLTKLPGIGKKTAERMILELKDKLVAGDSSEAGEDFAEAAGDGVASEAAAALISLGFSSVEIAPVLKKIKPSDRTEDVIKMALKELAGR